MRQAATRATVVAGMRLLNEAAALVGLKVVRGNLLGEEWFRKVAYFTRIIDRISGVDGDVAVCRVDIGKSLAVIASLIRSKGEPREIWGFDSWSAPDQTRRDHDPTLPQLAPATLAEVRLRLRQMSFRDLDGIHLVDGDLRVTLDHCPRVAFVDLDLLTLGDYRLCLEKLWPKVQPGGIVSFGNYAANEALERFVTDLADAAHIERDVAWHGRPFVVKSRAPVRCAPV
jgi:hypothetical protein